MYKFKKTIAIFLILCYINSVKRVDKIKIKIGKVKKVSTMIKKESFEMIMETVKGLPNAEQITEFCKKEIVLLEKKNASNENRKAKRDADHAELEEKILTVFADVPSITPKELAEELGLSPQKVSPRLKALTEKGILNRTQEKKNIFYTLVEMPETDVK